MARGRPPSSRSPCRGRRTPSRRAAVADMLSSRPVVMTTRSARDAGARAMEPRRLAVLVLAACALALPFFLWRFRTYPLASAAVDSLALLRLNPIAGHAWV